jgi:hypothetical protein
MRKLLAAAFLLALTITPAAAQVCSPVPALPDTERRTTYSISASTGPLSVGFQLYGDATDYANWVQVYVNSLLLPQAGNWTLASNSTVLATGCRPITDATITFNAAQTGTVQIVGVRRPRRASQFAENRGVAARDANQIISDMEAQLREAFDLRARTLQAPPGETLALLPSAALRASQNAIFDSNGNLTAGLPVGGGALVSAAMQPIVNAATVASAQQQLSINPPGSGLVSSTVAACSQTAVGTLSTAECVNPQTGTSYPIADGDRAKLVTGTNAAAQAYTIAQAGAANIFQAGWYVDVKNLSTNPLGIITITPTGSTIGGNAALTLGPGQSVRIVSDGTNYQTPLLTGVVTLTAWKQLTGSGNYVPSVGMAFVNFTCVGAGAGGGSVANQTGSNSAGGTGGGAGSSSTVRLTAAQIGASQPYVSGAAGAGGTAPGGNGGNGGDTTLGSTLCVGKGGIGGGAAGNGSAGAGGNGGVAGTGDVTNPGAPGGVGDGVAITSVTTHGGFGASSPYGGGGQATSIAATHIAGNAATGCGAGGSGAASNEASVSVAGGAGSAGCLFYQEALLQ